MGDPTRPDEWTGFTGVSVGQETGRSRPAGHPPRRGPRTQPGVAGTGAPPPQGSEVGPLRVRVPRPSPPAHPVPGHPRRHGPVTELGRLGHRDSVPGPKVTTGGIGGGFRRGSRVSRWGSPEAGVRFSVLEVTGRGRAGVEAQRGSWRVDTLVADRPCGRARGSVSRRGWDA